MTSTNIPGDELNACQTTMRQVARACGDILRHHFRRRDLCVTTKQNDYDIVTTADKESEQQALALIRARHPDHSVLTEESGADLLSSPWQWVIDPLDGTTNFSTGFPYFNVSVGLKHRGETVMGTVLAPVLGECFEAVRGQGAVLNGNPIAPSAVTALSEAVVTTGFPYDKATTADNNLPQASRVTTRVRALRCLGSAALDISYVAAGFLDGYWEISLHEWDVCAAELIAQEAGAVTRRYRGDRGVSLLAAAPGIASPLLALLTCGSHVLSPQEKKR